MDAPVPAFNSDMDPRTLLILICIAALAIGMIIVFLVGATAMLVLFYKAFAWGILFLLGCLSIFFAIRNPDAWFWLKLIVGIVLISVSFVVPGMI